MDFKHILSEIGKTDASVYEQQSDRRGLLKSFGAKVALVSMPFAAGSLFNKAAARTTDTVTDALNFILELEYFQYNFYNIANHVASVTPLTLIPAVDAAGFAAIEAHQKAHISFLITTITSLGGIPFKPAHYGDANSTPPYIPNAYDFRAAANTAYAPVFANVFTDYPTFLVAAQTFEDTMIRAYNAQLVIMSGNAIYGQIQQLLATEGRHAAYVRLLRRNMNAIEIPAPWINNNIPPLSAVPTSNSVLQPFYNGEENTQQLNVTIDALAGTTGTIPTLSATAAFDEPMSKQTALGLLTPFILV